MDTRILFLFCLFFAISNGDIDIAVKRKNKTKMPNVSRDENGIKSTSALNGYANKLQAFQNVEYKGVVSVGQPAQVFDVIMDTGSDVFWLPKVGCTSSGPDVSQCISGKGLYNPSLSSTAVDLRTRFQVIYGTGSAFGDYYSEQMAFGDTRENHVYIGNVTMGAASRMTYSDEAILGLSFAQTGDPTPVFELAVQRGIFTQPIFSVYLSDCDDECENGGQIRFGGIDTDHCNEVIGTAQVIGSTPYWLFELSGISIGGRVLANQRLMRAIVDTGTSVIAGHSSLIQQIAFSLGAQQTRGAYIVPCDSRLQLEFNINGQLYKVTHKELILAGVITSFRNQKYCQLAIDGDNNLDFIILGSPFIRAYCLIHNVKSKTISFAPVKTTGNNAIQSSRPDAPRNTNNNWPFGNSPFGNSPLSSNNNWPFSNNNNWPFGNSPFGNFPSWQYGNRNPFLQQSWNSPFFSDSYFYNQPY